VDCAKVGAQINAHALNGLEDFAFDRVEIVLRDVALSKDKFDRVNLLLGHPALRCPLFNGSKKTVISLLCQRVDALMHIAFRFRVSRRDPDDDGRPAASSKDENAPDNR
jgi:hypothetical protein